MFIDPVVLMDGEHVQRTFNNNRHTGCPRSTNERYRDEKSVYGFRSCVPRTCRCSRHRDAYRSAHGRAFGRHPRRLGLRTRMDTGPYGGCHPMGYLAPRPAYGFYARPYAPYGYYGRRCWWRGGVRVCN
jgi:hypothetical protein